ncbi:enoyl-CoA hydratase/isomerase family protein [Streptomyces sp. NPDC059893]|uniref:enoyl-CoA hydratase/isomerase family protein n=1 Tax=Streptomyces sp. NPDC059893 TaxID=3346990 RepID=UPI00364F5D1A
MPCVPVISPAQLACGAAHSPLLDEDAAPQTPVIAVDVDVPTALGELAAATRRAREGDRLLVGLSEAAPADLSPGVAQLAQALDMTLTAREPAPGDHAFVHAPEPATALAEIANAASASQRSALVLAALLRMTETQPIREALDAESLAYSTLLGGAEFRQWLATRGPRRRPAPEPDPVLIERDGDVLSVTLNRPARRNAYDRHMRDALVEALTLAVHDRSLNRVVLTGAGPAFCSGGDLDEFGTAPDPVTAHLLRTRAGAGRLLHQLRDRVEARVHGTCVGSGIELPAFAGTVRAAPGTTFRLPEIAMGLIPGAGGTVSIPRRIGRWRTLHLALTGRTLAASTALSWGLIDSLDVADTAPPGVFGADRAVRPLRG